MRGLELRIPPPLVAAGVALAMWGLAGLTGLVDAPDGYAAWRRALVFLLVGAGVAFDLSALISFRRAQTTINPMRPQSSSALVTTGVYRLSRNPMYVGQALLLCAWAAHLGSIAAWIGPLVFTAYLGRFQIAPEEKALSAAFGDVYRAYASKVRRWL